jgi:hypothetical protein
MTEDTARNIHALLLKATGAIDESVAVVQASGVAGEELSDYKHSAGRTLAAIFDELLMPLYEEHRMLVPPELAGSLKFRDG